MLGAGEILRSDGSNYKGKILKFLTIILELPGMPLTETSINIFQKLVADRGDGWSGSGIGIPAAKYSDCSTVQLGDLAAGRVRFSVALQSFYPNLDGYDSVNGDGYGVIIDDIIGIFINQAKWCSNFAY